MQFIIDELGYPKDSTEIFRIKHHPLCYLKIGSIELLVIHISYTTIVFLSII